MLYTNADLLTFKEPQFVFLYNGIKKGFAFHNMLHTSPCHGTGVTRSTTFKMQTISNILPTVLGGGDCAISGEIYKVKEEVFKSLVGFHYGHIPIKVKVTGHKKRVWMWVLPSDHKFLLKTLDIPSDMVYNWGNTTVTNTAPLTTRKEPVMPQTVINFEVPISYTPTVTVEDTTVNKDVLCYKLLTLLDTLDEAIWDTKMTNKDRGDVCRETLDSLYKEVKAVVKVFA